MAHYEVIEGWNNEYDYGSSTRKNTEAVSLPDETVNEINKLLFDLEEQGRLYRYFANGEETFSYYEPSQDKPIYIKKKFKDLAGAVAYKKIIDPFNPCYFDIIYIE